MVLFLNRLSVRNRIWAIVAVFIAGIVVGSIIDVLMLRDTLWREKERATRQQVETGYSVLTYYHALQKSGEMSEAAAQAGAMRGIKALRYDGTEYFWLNDLGVPRPKMVMHPIAPEFDGRLLDGAQFDCVMSVRVGDDGAFRALDGKPNLFAAFVALVGQNGHGYVRYTWPKPVASGGVGAQRYAKLSYIKKFEPWGWLIGTGVYVDDVERALRRQAMRNLLMAAGAGLVLSLLASMLARSITRPLRLTVAAMRAIGGGDFAVRMAVEGDSEIAELARGCNGMLEHLEARDAELALQRASLEEKVACRTSELLETNLRLEQELAARKLVEHAERESRARMLALLNASDESVLLLEPEGKILAVNALGAARVGQTPEQIIGRIFFDLMPPELAITRRAAVRQVAVTGEPIHTRDQRGFIFFDNSLYPVKDEYGAVESVAIYAKDVSEQRRAKQVEDIFRRIDTVLLKWRIDLESIAQMFCEEILPAFNLVAAWVGRAETDGRMSLIASSEVEGYCVLDQLRGNPLRWDDDVSCCAPVGAALRSGQRQVVRLNQQNGRPCGTQSCGMAARAAGARALLLLPLTLRGATWGVLTLYGREVRQFEQPELEYLAAIADRFDVSLESAAQQEWLTLLDTALAGVGNAVVITNANAGILWVNLAFENMSGYGMEEVLGKMPEMFSAGAQDAIANQLAWKSIQPGTVWRGELLNARPDGQRYTVTQTVTPLRNVGGQVSHYVAIIEDISERKANEQRMHHSANFDLLTDLPNRACFFDRLGQALALARRDGQHGALMFLDLDRFKQVNDQLGHAAGDSLLVGVANRLRELVRESDTVARLAGDEFTVILPNLNQTGDAAAIADKILAAIGAPFTIAGAEVMIGISIGIALFPRDGCTVQEILNAADDAMYQAKKAGRQRYAFATTARQDPAGTGARLAPTEGSAA